jgi:hypothetical protein
MKSIGVVAFVAVLLFGHSAAAEKKGIGVHGAVGTDVTLGLGFGVGVTWVLPQTSFFTYEFGAQLFFHKSTYEDTEGIHDYEETTELYLLAARANALFNHHDGGLYYIAGGGLAASSVSWVERSPTDTSLGTPLDDGGSKQEVDATALAAIASAGIGYNTPSGLDLRFEVPLLIFFSEVGEAATIVPTLVASAGYRF